MPRGLLSRCRPISGLDRGEGFGGVVTAMSAAPLATLVRFGQRAVSFGRATSRRGDAARARATATTSAMGSTARTLRGVIMDMDGTLTVPNHDFAEMYRRVGCKTKDILTEIEGWPEAERARANAIIHEMETEALATMRRMPGAARLGAFLDAKGVPRGLVTRNVQASVAHFHANAWPLPPFAPALAREFKPYKPAPDALLHICAHWGVHPSEVCMIGDSAKDDVVSGNRAGCVTVLLDQEGKWRLEGDAEKEKEDAGANASLADDNGTAVDNVLRGEMVPTFVVSSLAEVAPLLERHFEFVALDAAEGR